MGRFSFNPNDVQVGFPVFPKNSYELDIGEPKVKYYEGKEGKPDRVMLGYPCKIVEGEFKNKPYYLQFDLNNEYGIQNAKAAVMAAKGFVPNQDNLATFNEQYGHLDGDVNTDDGTCGEFWQLAKGGRIVVDLDTDINKESGKLQQKFPQNLRPVGVDNA